MFELRASRTAPFRWAAYASVLSATLLAAGPRPAAAQLYSAYQIVELAPFDNGTATTAEAVNDAGNVVGTLTIPDPDGQISAGVQRAYHWTNGVYRRLNPLTGGNSSFATSLNNSDQVVGYRDQLVLSINQQRQRGFVWSPLTGASVQNIPNLGATETGESRGMAINDAGLVAGYSTSISGPGNWRAIRYQVGGSTTALPFVAGQTTRNTFAYGIAPNGRIVGLHELDVNGSWLDRGFSWTSNTTTDLGAFFPSFLTSHQTTAYDANDAGVIVGQAEIDFNTFRAIRRSGVSWFSIPLLSGPGSDPADDSNVANAVNASGVIVGNSEIGNTNRRAFGFDPGRAGAAPVDLNTLIPTGTGWVLEDARDISDSGYIVGNGKRNGLVRGFLLRPLVRLSGKVTLEDWLASTPGVMVTFELKSLGGQLLESHTIPLGANGTYAITTARRGTFRVTAKASHWLSDRQSTVDLTVDRPNVDFSLPNGDCDGDNSVTVFDYDLLSLAFDTAKGGPGYDARADLDGDGNVTVFDYDILSTNFDRTGLD